jgi:hypothetical protein
MTGVKMMSSATVTTSRTRAIMLVNPGRSTAHRAWVWVTLTEARAG